MALTDKQILAKYKELPEDVRKAMFSVATSSAIIKIGGKHSLNVEEDGLLAREIGLVMLGINRARDLPQNLEKNLALSKEKAWEIARDINHMIFFEVRENLKKLQGIPETEALLPEEGRTPLKEEAPAPQVNVEEKKYWDALKSPPSPSAASQQGAKSAPETKVSPAPIETLPAKPETPKPEKAPLVIQPEPMETPAIPAISALGKPVEKEPKPPAPPAPAAPILPSVPAVAPKPPTEQKPPPGKSPEKAAAPAPVKYESRDPYREPIEN